MKHPGKKKGKFTLKEKRMHTRNKYYAMTANRTESFNSKAQNNHQVIAGLKI